MDVSPLNYSYLAPGTDSIRLLCIQPHDPTKPEVDALIHCTLHTVSLSDCPRYEALSYTWGNFQGYAAISLNGHRHVVGRNLFQALVQLRQPFQERIVWIDALCINQDDDQERNHQVAQMCRIYSTAVRVIIWLEGHHPGEPEKKAIPFIVAVAKGSIERGACGKPRYKRYWKAIGIFLNLPYWERLWIKQEVVLASEIVIVWGRKTLHWKHWDAFLHTIHKYDPNEKEFRICSELLDLAGSRPDMLSEQRARHIQDETLRLPLVDLLGMFGDAACQDRRDRVFGLLGFARKCCFDAVGVNYGYSATQLCSTLMNHHIEAHTPLASESENLRLFFAIHSYLYDNADFMHPGVPSTRGRVLSRVIYTIPLLSIVPSGCPPGFHRPQTPLSDYSSSEHLEKSPFQIVKMPGYLNAISTHIFLFRHSMAIDTTLPTPAQHLLRATPDQISNHIQVLARLLNLYPGTFLRPQEVCVFLDDKGLIALGPNTLQAGDFLYADFSSYDLPYNYMALFGERDGTVHGETKSLALTLAMRFFDGPDPRSKLMELSREELRKFEMDFLQAREEIELAPWDWEPDFWDGDQQGWTEEDLYEPPDYFDENGHRECWYLRPGEGTVGRQTPFTGTVMGEEEWFREVRAVGPTLMDGIPVLLEELYEKLACHLVFVLRDVDS